MSSLADKNLSKAAQDQINAITEQAKSGQISWAEANKKANEVRAGEGAGFTVSAKGTTTYNDGSTISSYKTGSQVAGGGSAQKTVNLYGGGNNGYGSFEDFMSMTGYDKYAEQTQAAIKAAVDKAVKGYSSQIDTTNRDSDDLARQAYIAKMQGQKNLDQQMAANGYAGGMADSQRIATEADYQNRLSDIEKQREVTVRELETAIANAKLTGDMQTAQELADYLRTIESQWAAYVQSQQSMNNQNYWNQQNLDMQAIENNRSWVMQQLQMGMMPDDDALAAAGITKPAAQQQVALALSGGSGTVSKTAQGTPGRTQGGGYNNGSLTSAQVQELQKALGVTADGLWGNNSKAAAGGMTADEAWEAYQQTNPVTSRFSGLAYQTLIQNQQYDQADAYLAQFWDTMSDADRTRATIIFNKYGPKQNASNPFMGYLDGTVNEDPMKGNIFIDKYGI